MSLMAGNSILALIAQLRAVFIGRDELVTGTAITNLNADMVDGLHAATSGANAHVLATDESGNLSIGSVIASTAIGAHVRHSVAVATATGSYPTLAFNSELFDTDTIHDTVTNNSRLTCKHAGVYVITTQIRWSANATGYRQSLLKLNGATYIASLTAVPSASWPTEIITNTIYSLAVNDYIEVQTFQNSGGNLNVESYANYTPEFSMVRVA